MTSNTIVFHEPTREQVRFINELKPVSGEEAQLQEVMTKAREAFAIGDTVFVKYTGYTGKVVGYNNSLGGFYPGIRFPVLVRITHADDPKWDDVVGSVYQYQLDQLTKPRYYKVDCRTIS